MPRWSPTFSWQSYIISDDPRHCRRTHTLQQGFPTASLAAEDLDLDAPRPRLDGTVLEISTIADSGSLPIFDVHCDDARL